nr:acyl carrier protein [Rubellimicrobium mesophilum]
MVLGLAPLIARAQDDIAGRVRQIVAEHFRIAETQVTDEASLKRDLGADELDLVELVMAFDAAFGTRIPDAEIDGMRTVGDAVRIVAESPRS